MHPPAMFQLTESDQRLLLQIVRSSVRAHLSGGSMQLPPIVSGSLTDVYGIFVSIHRHSELRGCIGSLHTEEPLYRSVADCAIAAAVGDPRFQPLTAGDLPEVDFEISVLSPMQLVQNIGEIEIGTHGLMITKGNSRGLLLPQVATQYGWDRERFLQETCRKAGLKSDDWKHDAIIHCFSALVFGEKQFHLTTAP